MTLPVTTVPESKLTDLLFFKQGLHEFVNSTSMDALPTTSGHPSHDVYTKFRLEQFMADYKNPEDIELLREVERLLSVGKYQAAHDAYLNDTIATVPETYQEFIENRIGNGIPTSD